MNSLLFKFLILVCFCSYMISCGSDDELLENIDEEIVEEDIEECLLPQRIVIGGAIFGDSFAEYEYENNRLVSFDNSTYFD